VPPKHTVGGGTLEVARIRIGGHETGLVGLQETLSEVAAGAGPASPMKP
jgi:hypothetical protein